MQSRIELKFDITNQDEKKIISKLCLLKEFETRKITSIYFDNDDFRFYHDSEEGITPRHKLRLRYYNDNFNKKNLEIKSTLPTIRKKISIKNVEINQIKKYAIKYKLPNNIKPCIKISYLRKYFKNKKGRFNIDYNITFSKYSIVNSFETKRLNKKILEYKTSDTEQKFNFLSNFLFKETRSSKYCDAISHIYKI